MTEAKDGGGELVEDGGIAVRVIVLVIAAGSQVQVESLHVVVAQDTGQEL